MFNQITFINSTVNAVLTIDYQPFIDYRLWIVLLFTSVLCLALSHAMRRGNELWAVFAFIFALASGIGTIGLALIPMPVMQIVNETWENISANTTIITPTYDIAYSVITLGSIWLLVLFVVYIILVFLNIIYIYVEITAKKELPKMKTPVQLGTQETWDVNDNDLYPR